MKREEIFNELAAIISEILESKQAISEDTALIGEDIMDSLSFMNYITTVEEKYDIRLSDEEIQNNQLGILRNMIDMIVVKKNDKTT